MKIFAFSFLALSTMLFFVDKPFGEKSYNLAAATPLFQIRSIDTMKSSRDLAREKLNDTSFDEVIDSQVREIAQTGASHIALDTPYDDEFVPFLARWVSASRKYNIKVWFRGNLSGWEGWFNYPKIKNQEHTDKVVKFILKNKDLFEDGDIFTSCPECENGGPGDPRRTGDVVGFRNFLITENAEAEDAFNKIGKKIDSGYYSMNGDVAALIMDKKTTNDLGGVITIDHYVKTPEKLINDAKKFINESDGDLVLGEWGIPIPDINGKMSDSQREDWIKKALEGLSQIKNIKGLNYWTSRGGTTALWKDQSPNKISDLLSQYFQAIKLKAKITDDLDVGVPDATISTEENIAVSDQDGNFEIVVMSSDKNLEISKESYKSAVVPVEKVPENIVISPTNPSLLYRIRVSLHLY